MIGQFAGKPLLDRHAGLLPLTEVKQERGETADGSTAVIVVSL